MEALCDLCVRLSELCVEIDFYQFLTQIIAEYAEKDAEIAEEVNHWIETTNKGYWMR